MNPTYQLTGFEAQSRIMIDAALDANNKSKDWSSARTGILMVFKAQWSAALPVDRIVTLARALCSVEWSEETVQAELTRMTREKFLRSYASQGRRLYELNFTAE